MVNNKKLEEWMNMDYDEKRKYNGFKGFVEGILFKDNNCFMEEDRAKLKRRIIKEKIWRDKKKLEKTKMEKIK